VKRTDNFKHFSDLVDDVLKVPLSEVKAKSQEEKRAKKRKKSKKPSVFCEGA
jgi:hypothetical protein